MIQRLKASFNRLPRAVRWLIVGQVGLYLLLLVLGDSEAAKTVIGYTAFFPDRITSGWVWTFVTYLPFHMPNDPFGLLFDIMLLWSLGGIFGHRWRERHFLFFYIAGGVGGALVDWLLFLALPSLFYYPLMGTSGCTFALFTAFWLVLGDMPVSVFGSAPMRGKWVFYAIAGLEVLFFFTGGNHHFGVQIGGVLTGWLLVTGRWRPRKLKAWLDKGPEAIRRKKREQEKSRFRVIH